MRCLQRAFIVTGMLCLTAYAAPRDGFDYHQANRERISRGVQAVLMCNGLFTSGRTLEQVFEQELAYLDNPLGTADGGDYTVEHDVKAVAIGTPGNPPVARAAFRQGLGCVVMAPDRDREDVETLPRLALPPPQGDAADIPWPDATRRVSM